MRHRWIAALVIIVLSGAAGCRPVSDGDDHADSSAPEPVPPVSATLSPSLSNVGPGDYTFTLDHDGRTRGYIVHVPERLTEPAAVVVALHGGGGTGAPVPPMLS